MEVRVHSNRKSQCPPLCIDDEWGRFLRLTCLLIASPNLKGSPETEVVRCNEGRVRQDSRKSSDTRGQEVIQDLQRKPETLGGLSRGRFGPKQQ